MQYRVSGATQRTLYDQCMNTAVFTYVIDWTLAVKILVLSYVLVTNRKPDRTGICKIVGHVMRCMDKYDTTAVAYHIRSTYIYITKIRRRVYYWFIAESVMPSLSAVLLLYLL